MIKERHDTGTDFNFVSKAHTLKKLREYEDLGIPKLYFFSVEDWQSKKNSILDVIASEFPGQSLAVRSSSLNEDSTSTSAAGAFLSLLNVPAEDPTQLEEAIHKVIDSYGVPLPEDQVLIQIMMDEPAITGVIMTRSLSDGSDYYVINYDDESGKTDTITGGKSINKTVSVYRDVRDGDFDSARLRNIVQLARRVEEICQCTSLDIEFCMDRAGILHLLQVRPICASKNWTHTGYLINEYIKNVVDFVAAKTGRQNNIYGPRSILGIMPDWNPAEMIGILPRPLDTSLYRELITSRVWASARGRMGYHIPPSCDLMLVLAGHPYIDIRLSFNSFIPRGLDSVTAEALVSAWLEYLASHPQFHDKVEFEVALTCMDFCFEINLDKRYNGLLTSSRRQAFREALAALTAEAMSPSADASLNFALERITELRARHVCRPLLGAEFKIGNLGAVLAECRKYGTLPFSIIARHAFIAESLLKTAVYRGALKPERLNQFKHSIKTISGELSHDFREVCHGNHTGRSFMEKYGHLRPGSYNILSPRYVDRDYIFEGANTFQTMSDPVESFILTNEEKTDLDKLLKEATLPPTAEHLMNYARQAIAGRELGKFVFSRNLSDALEIIAGWADSNGFDRDDASFIPVRTLLDLDYEVGVATTQKFFCDLIARNREEYEKWRTLKLGYLIRAEGDIYIVPQHRAAPNFIGQRKIQAPLIRLYADSTGSENLAGKIVLIENADPGFDWIFTRDIAGLITKFGGANSHMAIRCAEYGLPAAIGIGESLFEKMIVSRHAILDPANAILREGDHLC